MSSALNRVMLMGNLTRDPNVRNTPNGTPYADLGLAINESYQKNGQKVDKTCFLDVVVWDRQASACGEYLRKGSPVFIEGRLQLDEWNDKQSGEKRTKLRVRADRVHFMGQRQDAAESGHRDGGAPEAAEDDFPPAEPAPARQAAARPAVPARRAA